MFGATPPLADMASSQEEVKRDIAEWAGGPEATSPKYPYGLSLSFDDDTLKKLGFDGPDLPSPGAMVTIMAQAKVTSASSNEMEKADGSTKTCRRVELQITRMAVSGVDDMQAQQQRIKRWYGGTDAPASE